jgi:tellurium resistance protein TerD
MSINLSKGGSINLSKEDSSLTEVMVGLGWDINGYDSGNGSKVNFDLDASAFCLGPDGKCTEDHDMVFYNKDFSTHPSGAVKHLGDNRTGDGDGDDEQIMVNLPAVPANIDKIAFTVTIYDWDKYNINFGMVENAYIRLVNNITGQEICRCDLSEDYGTNTALVMGELYRHNGDWKFKAIEAGFDNGLSGLAGKYGLDAN